MKLVEAIGPASKGCNKYVQQICYSHPFGLHGGRDVRVALSIQIHMTLGTSKGLVELHNLGFHVELLKLDGLLAGNGFLNANT